MNVVKVDDTPVGIEAGRNAGCWTIGITRTGNCVGLSEQEAAAMPATELEELCSIAERRLTAAGAHYTVDSVADVLPLLTEIDDRCAKGELPI